MGYKQIFHKQNHSYFFIPMFILPKKIISHSRASKLLNNF